jgi:hypothetical protein
MNSRPSASRPASNTWAMFGWPVALASRTERRKRSTSSSVRTHVFHCELNTRTPTLLRICTCSAR